jgi:putative Ca2+/H+ antiporter (TMEM165/GDT1 family)
MDAFLLSFAVIFVAELGDKSQLMALAFATRYRAIDVLIGVTVATLLVHLASVVLGATVAAALPTQAIALLAGAAFFVFAAWTLRGDALDEDEANKPNRTARSIIIMVGTAFFLAELGDKTMLATITLATREEPVGTWIGSTAGMVVADAIAIAIDLATAAEPVVGIVGDDADVRVCNTCALKAGYCGLRIGVVVVET